MDIISHKELCELTAKNYFKNSDVVLWEYKAVCTSEEPDVLVYKGERTSLFEIKVSRSDFLADKKKICRKIHKNEHGTNFISKEFPYKKYDLKELGQLGRWRYFVCPTGLIKPEEVGHWGLIWFENGRFRIKKDSNTFRRNIQREMNLLVHALRKKTGLIDCNVLVRSFDPNKF